MSANSGAHHLTVGLIAQIKSFRAVTAAIAERIGPYGNGQRLERRGLAAGKRFAGQHPCDVGFHGQGDDFVGPVLEDANPDRLR